MLGDHDAAVTLAVKDLGVARDFYERVVGLREANAMPGGVLYKSGSTSVLVYESEYAGTNRATAASWNVGANLEREIEELRQNGVTFEHYDDLPGTTREGDVHSFGDFRSAWFKDPDGNILNLGSM
jgi:catechol 2,3-dioxygenase-like lactoylglutathione lyase family enzyme